MKWQNLTEPFRDPRKIYELIVGLFLLFVMLGIAQTSIFENFENIFLDLRFKLRQEVPFPDGIALIGIEEQSLDRLGHWPWPRSVHAELLYLLGQSPFRPATIGYDVLFESSNSDQLQGDAAFVERAKKFEQNLVMVFFPEKGSPSHYEIDPEKEKALEAFALPHSELGPKDLEQFDKVSLPILGLSQHIGLGSAYTPNDKDGRTRRMRLLMKYKDKVYPSLDLMLILRYLKAGLGDIRLEPHAIVIQNPNIHKVIPISAQGDMLINYYAGAINLPGYPFITVLNDGKRWVSGQKPEILNQMKDRIVLVGATALGMQDRRVTPFNHYESGIRVHAQAIANILENRYLIEASKITNTLILFGFGLVIIWMTMFLRITKSLPMLLGLIVLHFAMAYLFFIRGIWIDVAVTQLEMVVIFIGITSFRYFTALEELKRTQEQLIQSAKMASLGQLSAAISHEFRNILNAINLHVQYCSLPGITPEKMSKNMQRVALIMENANVILNGLLTFARKNEAVKTPGNLKKTVEDILLLVEKEMMRHQIEVKTELEEVPEISYDAGQISQVIMNLMNNARDALKDREGKIISLRLKKNVSNIQLDIGDNGSGIPPKVLKNLFQPFVTSKAAGKGTGLGLSVCHGLIRNHGGDIKVTTTQDKGTTWHIFLPLS